MALVGARICWRRATLRRIGRVAISAVVTAPHHGQLPRNYGNCAFFQYSQLCISCDLTAQRQPTFMYRNFSSKAVTAQNGHGRMRVSNLKETPTDAQTLLVIQPEYKLGPMEKPYVPAAFKLEEAVSLAEAISGWEVHSQRVDAIRRPHNRFLFGKGKTAELKSTVRGLPVTGVFINIPTLTPLQHRSLEQLFKKDVFDRFGIVLRIFKERAKTREAKVQVELAEVPYLKARIAEEDDRRFDQQRGGVSKMGGAGETPREIARRNLTKRERALKEELKEIRTKHKTASMRRAKHSLPVVAVVGYTNAGKTTLIKTLSKDDSMYPEDILFATLDTTMHAAKLPCGLKVLLVDTIGFISNLPHELVESFASTLEDVTNAHVIVHIQDASHPQSHAQRVNVLQVLRQLHLRTELLENMVEVLNKTDIATDSSSQIPKGALPISDSSSGTSTADLPILDSSGTSTAALPISDSSSGIPTAALPISDSSSGTSTAVLPISDSSSGIPTAALPISDSSSGTSTAVLPISDSSSGIPTAALPISDSSSGTSTAVLPISDSSSGIPTAVLPISAGSSGTSTAALPISAKKGTGMEELLHRIEEAVLKATHQGFWRIVLPADGPQLSWLHHEATVNHVGPVEGDPEERGSDSGLLQVKAILSEAALGKFRAKFGKTVLLTENKKSYSTPS